MAVHPSTNYPGRTQENVLTQILRKKLEPDVEELVAMGKETAEVAGVEGIAQLQEVWNELREWTHIRIAGYVRDEASDAYTKEERAIGVDNVRTGLKRDLEDEDDGDDDDDDDEDEDDQDLVMGGTGQPQQPKLRTERGPEPETILWFAARGDFAVAGNVEYERKAGAYKGGQGVRFPSLIAGGQANPSGTS